MSLEGILEYTTRAAIFAAIVITIYIIWHKATGRRIRVFSVLAIFYMSALAQITFIREGISPFGIRAGWQLEPLVWTIYQLRGGWWTFFYPLLGNIFWFIPMGIVLGKRFGFFTTVLLAGLISFSIEVLQWLFNNGVSDIDDIIFNIAGAIIGYWLIYFFYKRIKQADKID